MRITVIGGTRFIGRRIVADLVARGDEVLVVHRGETEPPDLAPSRHLHVDRADFASIAGEVAAFAPDAVIDCLAMTRSDVDAVLPHLPDTQLILLSSMDVYEAFANVLHGGRESEPVPLNEKSRLRTELYPYRDGGVRPDDYDKLDVEPSYLERGAARAAAGHDLRRARPPAPGGVHPAPGTGGPDPDPDRHRYLAMDAVLRRRRVRGGAGVPGQSARRRRDPQHRRAERSAACAVGPPRSSPRPVTRRSW